MKPEVQDHGDKVRLTYRHPVVDGQDERRWLEHIRNMRAHGSRYGTVLNVVSHSTHTHVWVR